MIEIKYTFVLKYIVELGIPFMTYQTTSKLSTLFLVFSLYVIFIYIGFEYVSPRDFPILYNGFKFSTLIFGAFSLTQSLIRFRQSVKISDKVTYGIIILLFALYLFIGLQWIFNADWINIYERQFVLMYAIATAVISISHKITLLSDIGIHPSVLFVLSFVVLITISSLLLLMPAATEKGISPLDAFFTATSAATVTGLSVVDTQTHFTLWGKIIILITIQLGGLGVLTFTNLFGLLFKSATSYKNHVALSTIINENNAAKAYGTLLKILGIAILVEIIGAILIYLSLGQTQVPDNKVFFSIFHSISAFCNAGFSTCSAGLYEPALRNNSYIQMIIIWLIITGGLGYNIMILHITGLKQFIYKKVNRYRGMPIKSNIIKYSDINTLIVVRTTAVLLILGAIGFYFLERDGVLRDVNGIQAFVSVLFNSVTPRTAGFNNIDMSQLALPTLLLIIGLMWVGASPGSTGGGIKTTTFAISLLNLYNQIRGKDNTIINWRVIPRQAVNQVNATIMLSILGINILTFLFVMAAPHVSFVNALFEVVSAFSTVGLSVGITASLGTGAKTILIIAMFLGRVSFLTFMIGVHRQIFGESRKENVYYPDENVFIN